MPFRIGRYVSWLGILCLIGGAAILSGCGSTYSASTLSRPPLEETERVVYMDMSLKTNLAVMDVGLDHINGLLRVRAKVKNTGHGRVNTEVRVKFLDKDGMELGQGAPWSPLPIEGGEIKTFESLASSKEATDWRLLFQLAGNH